MNTSATTFIRACRARPAASQNVLRAPSRRTATQPSPLTTSSRSKAILPCRTRAQPAQRAFLTTSLRHDAQPVNDMPSASSEGALDTALLGRASNETTNLPQNILSRTSTDPPSSSSPTTTTTSLDLALLPRNLPSSDLHFLTTSPTYTGTVTRVSSMQKTVRVTRHIQVLHHAYQKHYTRATHSFVHDPHNLLNEGDVIHYGDFPPSLRSARDKAGKIVVQRHRPKDRNGVVKELGVRYLVREIVSPFGLPLEMRRSRIVGGGVGRWKGTDGEVKKVQVRQKGRKDGKKAKAKTMSKKATAAPAEEKKELLNT